jgi:hypothetical protein
MSRIRPRFESVPIRSAARAMGRMRPRPKSKLLVGQKFGAADRGRKLPADETRLIEQRLRAEGRL